MDIWNWISKFHSGRVEDFKTPAFAKDIRPYRRAYADALKFTKSLGYDTSLLSLNSDDTSLLAEDGDFLMNVAKSAEITQSLSHHAAAQCLKWSHFLKPFYEKELGKRVILTTGQFWKRDQCMFKPTFEDAKNWNKHGIQAKDFGNQGHGLKLHAWLTVESGEIIDPTLMSSFANIDFENYGKYSGYTVYGHADNVLNYCKYVPITVGSEVVEEMTKNFSSQLLATKPDELKMKLIST